MIRIVEKIKLANLDKTLFVILAVVLATHYLKIFTPQFDAAILITVAALAIIPVILETLKSLKEKKISIDLLAAIALVFSVLAKEYISAVFINLMLTSARILGDYTENRSRRAIESLFKLKPKKARIKIDDRIVEMPIDKIKKYDLIIVELGERIPVDGIVLEGEAAIDQSSLTGESLPVEKKPGDSVSSSTVVVSGNLLIKTEKIGKETAFEKIIELVEQATTHKPKITTFTDKFTTLYVLSIFAGSAILYAATSNLILVLAVVLVVSADDIAVAIPLAFLASIGHAAKKGVIIKGGDFLEGLNKVKVVVVDKTGTLTYGRLKVDDFFTFGDFNRNEILSLAASASLLSPHPSAKAILKYTEKNSLKPDQPEKFEEYSGKGSRSVFRNKEVIVGKTSFLKENNIKITEHQLRDIEREKEKGLNATLIGYGGELTGFFTLSDEIRLETENMIGELKSLGVEKIVMLTGDNERIAAKVAKKVGITDYYANLLPQDKLEYLKKYLSPDYKVAAIGDGVNDAALLNAADIGIAMGGTGADVTIESGDIVLMHDNLLKVTETMRLARYTAAVAKQDFMIWAITNAAGFYFVFSGIIPVVILPTFASTYNFLTDFIPILNSTRLFGVHIKE